MIEQQNISINNKIDWKNFAEGFSISVVILLLYIYPLRGMLSPFFYFLSYFSGIGMFPYLLYVFSPLIIDIPIYFFTKNSSSRKGLIFGMVCTLILGLAYFYVTFYPVIQARNQVRNDEKVFTNSVGTSNVSKCLEIKDPEDRSQCVYEIARDKNIPSACEHFRKEGKTDDSAIGGCYVSVANFNKNWALCDGIKDHDQQSACFFGKCGDSATVTERDQCYFSIVSQRGYKKVFKDVCEFISDTDLKNKCENI